MLPMNAGTWAFRVPSRTSCRRATAKVTAVDTARRMPPRNDNREARRVDEQLARSDRNVTVPMLGNDLHPEQLFICRTSTNKYLV